MPPKVSKRILIVDDVLSMLLALLAGLEQMGYEVTTASSGQSALQQLPKNPPDLVVLDIAMPGMDGWEVFEEIRKISSVPIIMLSGFHISAEDLRRGVEMGVSAYLSKPISLEKLVGCIQVTLNQA
jgi:CheY-like chemotaxis protein